MRRWSVRVLLGVPLLLLGLLLTAVAAWGVDKMVHVDQVNRNVLVAGVPVGGLDDLELDSILRDLAADSADDPVIIRAPGLDITVANAEAGITVDTAAMRSAVLDAGREANPVSSFSTWVTALRNPLEIEPIYQIDLEVVQQMIRSAPGWVRVAPTEPSFTAASGEMVVTPGADGEYLDPAVAAEALAAEVAFGSAPFSVDVTWSPLAPELDQEDVTAALDHANDLVDSTLTVRVNGETARIGTTTLTRWIDSTVLGDELVPVFNEDRVQQSLERLLDGYTSDYPEPVYSVENDEVSFGLGGPPAMRCCGAGAADLLYREAEKGGAAFVFLPTRPAEEDGGSARVETLGVTELVSEFTTNHACCESRVTNIHQIADVVRGVVVKPGERFSVNDFVGERTVEKGFVPAGAIQQGHFKDDVGGGVSQFATTLFNAAFFAGLEFDDYQSHTIYLSRYPYGREATLNFPDVDLAVINNTPFGVLIWTEYDDTSITVQMYSTKYWDVEQTDQRSWRSGACRSVETFRSRTNPAGEVVEDSVKARYRPGEGLDCAGNPTPKPRG
ncbi:MAG: VanW family protein [Acidimicrobiia bacterium]|nr:VanW family protein [Acidimicrobiia bacterium]